MLDLALGPWCRLLLPVAAHHLFDARLGFVFRQTPLTLRIPDGSISSRVDFRIRPGRLLQAGAAAKRAERELETDIQLPGATVRMAALSVERSSLAQKVTHSW
jgi:hypothetical protein